MYYNIVCVHGNFCSNLLSNGHMLEIIHVYTATCGVNFNIVLILCKTKTHFNCGHKIPRCTGLLCIIYNYLHVLHVCPISLRVREIGIYIYIYIYISF